MLNTAPQQSSIQLPSIHSLLDFPNHHQPHHQPALPPFATISASSPFQHPVQLSAYNLTPSPVTQAQQQPVAVSPHSPPTMRSSSVPQVMPMAPVHPPSPGYSEDEASMSPSSVDVSPMLTKKSWKPRKKRQCPECKLYFSNLATHKSTHLKPASRPHICKYCSRGFARPNDLFRHIKCHWKEIGSDKGQFKCPFKNDGEGDDHCCHNTGIFSRCDTFKNHLKAIHFQYPNGTKKDQRTKVSGKCRMCQAEFRNVDDWMNNHIEKDQCSMAVTPMKKEA
ncbi:transcriptional regulator Stp4p [Diutina catenulata]